MSFTAELVDTLVVREVDGYGVAPRTTEHRIHTLRLTGGSRQQSQLVVVSAGVSNQEIILTPIAASAPGLLLWLATDQPLDVRLNASNASMLSALRGLVLGASISALFVTPPSNVDANVRLVTLAGGSVVASIPNP
jgi:hypothetical protein